MKNSIEDACRSPEMASGQLVEINVSTGGAWLISQQGGEFIAAFEAAAKTPRAAVVLV